MRTDRPSTQQEADNLNSGTTFIVYNDDPDQTIKDAIQVHLKEKP